MQGVTPSPMNPDSSRIYFDTPATKARAVGGKKGDAAKHYLEKVAKLVPIEIVGAYEAAILLVSEIKPESIHMVVYWILFGLGLLGTLCTSAGRLVKSSLNKNILLLWSRIYCLGLCHQWRPFTWASNLSGRNRGNCLDRRQRNFR